MYLCIYIMNNIQFFIIIILVIILFINIKLNKTKEPFDLLQDNVRKEDCGRACTKSPTCKGFAYNTATLECYLSKNQILGPPSAGQYSREYSSELMRCNKIRSLSDNKRVIPENPDDQLKYNTIYLCAPNEKADYEFYQIVNGEMNKTEKKLIDYLPDIEYVVEEIDWTNKQKDYVKQILLPPLEEDEYKLKPYNVYDVDDKENLGQYMLPHKCVSEIPLEQCLETCNEHKECIGVEWNPLYKDNKNVCCPKIEITKKITRRPEFEHGNFYVKNNKREINKNKMFLEI
jgi:hypothetical protein